MDGREGTVGHWRRAGVNGWREGDSGALEEFLCIYNK